MSGLEAAPDRGLNTVLGLGVAHALAEEIRIATEVIGGRERDGIDWVLDGGMAAGQRLARTALPATWRRAIRRFVIPSCDEGVKALKQGWSGSTVGPPYQPLDY